MYIWEKLIRLRDPFVNVEANEVNDLFQRISNKEEVQLFSVDR